MMVKHVEQQTVEGRYEDVTEFKPKTGQVLVIKKARELGR